MKYKIVVFILLVSFNAIAQDSTGNSTTLFDKFTEDVGIFGEDAFGFFTAPARFSGTDWLYAAGAAGGSFLLLSVDAGAKRSLGRKSANTLNQDFWDIPTYYGYIGPANVISLTVYAAGLFTGEDNIRTTGRLAFEAISISGISVMAIRYIFGRSRPYYNEGPRKFNWFEASNEIQSFPSGHTVVAFAMSTIFAEQIDNIWARIGFYGMAALTGFARVHNNQHWLSDVITGAALGMGAGFYVLNKEEERTSPASGKKGKSLTIFPGINGINLKLQF
jgi:membrane-associated phospholipid phosphatase